MFIVSGWFIEYIVYLGEKIGNKKIIEKN